MVVKLIKNESDHYNIAISLGFKIFNNNIETLTYDILTYNNLPDLQSCKSYFCNMIGNFSLLYIIIKEITKQNIFVSPLVLNVRKRTVKCST